MEITRDNILEVVYESIEELNEQRSKDQYLECLPQTPLGDRAGLDSLGFVNLVALIEEKCQDRFGRSLVLSEMKWRTGMRDPFETVSSLADFIEDALTGKLASWY
jgi:acyl carrier protein